VNAVARPRRLLYVVSLFPCWSETFIVREISALIDAGVDVRILSLKPVSEALLQPDAARLLDRVRHPAQSLPPRAALAAPLVTAAMLLRLTVALWRHPQALAKSFVALARGLGQIDWVREFDPDLIHAHWATYPSTVAWALAQALHKPFGFTCHAHDIFSEDQLLREKIERAAVPVTISRFNVDWLAAHATPAARRRLRIVHCGVALTELPYRPDGREADLILAVGRLDPIKGFDVLIEALALLARSGRSFRCRLIGDGPQRAALQAHIARHGLQAMVTLCGALPQTRVREALYAAAVFVLPSVVCADGNRDGIPLGLMEAMAAGTPVLSTTVSGIPELIRDGEDGVLVAPRDPAALAEALGRALDAPEESARRTAAARARIEQSFDARREADKLLALFTEACRAA